MVFSTIPDYFNGTDKYLPITKPLLKQFDWYQIYDLFFHSEYLSGFEKESEINVCSMSDRFLIQRFINYEYQWVDLINLFIPHLHRFKRCNTGTRLNKKFRKEIYANVSKWVVKCKSGLSQPGIHPDSFVESGDPENYPPELLYDDEPPLPPERRWIIKITPGSYAFWWQGQEYLFDNYEDAPSYFTFLFQYGPTVTLAGYSNCEKYQKFVEITAEVRLSDLGISYSSNSTTTEGTNLKWYLGTVLAANTVNINIPFIPLESEEIILTYYQYVYDWAGCRIFNKEFKKYSLIKDQEINIQLDNVLPCSLIIVSDFNLVELNQYITFFNPNKYLFPDQINSFIAHINSLHAQIEDPDPYNNNSEDYSLGRGESIITTEDGGYNICVEKNFHLITANNNYWNQNLNQEDINPFNHPDLLKTDSEIFTNHLEMYDGELIRTMPDSPRLLETHRALLEVHRALEADKYGGKTNDTPNNLTIARLIKHSARILGFEVKPDGKLNQEYISQHKLTVADDPSVPIEDYQVGFFGYKGTLLKHLPNKVNGKNVKLGGIAKIHNIPQFLGEIVNILNDALNLQNSSSILVNHGDGNQSKYTDQLALLIDMAIAIKEIQQLNSKTYFSSVVTQEMTKEVIAGLGLPTINKSVKMQVNNKPIHLPYKGIQPERSIQLSIAEVLYNQGITNGQLL